VRILLAGLLCSAVAAGGDRSPWDSLRDAANTYIAAHADAPSGAAWEKKFAVKVESRSEATKLGRDEAAQSIVLDWMNDHEKPLREKQPAAILEACRIFCWLHARKLELPGVIRTELEKENRMQKFSEYLIAQAAVAVADKKQVN